MHDNFPTKFIEDKHAMQVLLIQVMFIEKDFNICRIAQNPQLTAMATWTTSTERLNSTEHTAKLVFIIKFIVQFMMHVYEFIAVIISLMSFIHS